MKYLIVGLGNIGPEYADTRHNVGFMAVDKMANDAGWTLDRNAYISEVRVKGRIFILVKPTTYMNLSGKAVSHHLKVNKIQLENLLVITDDLAIPFGTLRIRKNGSDGGHNGLKDINAVLETNNYARLRIGVGSNFHKGKQVDYVLSPFTKEEQFNLSTVLEHSAKAAFDFGFIGIDKVMSIYNKSFLPEKD